MEPASPARLYAAVAGLALFVLGIAGFFHGVSFWLNMLYLATGSLGIFLGGTAPRTYALGVGAIFTVLGILGPALALVVGIPGLLAAAGTPRGSFSSPDAKKEPRDSEARAQAAG